MDFIFKVLSLMVAVVVVSFGLLMILVLGVFGAAGVGQGAGDGMCREPVATGIQTTGGMTNTTSTGKTAHAMGTPPSSPTPAPTATGGAADPCFSSSPYGAQVVVWAKAMADALAVNPACGAQRTPPDCDRYTFYTSTFPPEVIQYGEAWCQMHGDCASWTNGNYQCVSFVRGAYSQVYPMTLTNDAFNLWFTYQHQPGWQEIPAAAGDVTERGMPEPGDVMVFKDLGVGHAAIVLAVTAPHNEQNGEVVFANANSTSPYDHMPLQPNLLVDTSAWSKPGNPHSNIYTVWGYLRPKANPSEAFHAQQTRSSVERLFSFDNLQNDLLLEKKGDAYVAL